MVLMASYQQRQDHALVLQLQDQWHDCQRPRRFAMFDGGSNEGHGCVCGGVPNELFPLGWSPLGGSIGISGQNEIP